MIAGKVVMPEVLFAQKVVMPVVTSERGLGREVDPWQYFVHLHMPAVTDVRLQGRSLATVAADEKQGATIRTIRAEKRAGIARRASSMGA